MRPRHGSRLSLALGSFSLLAALAPAPREQDQAGPSRELASARAKLCERMVDYYREAQKNPPKPNNQDADAYLATYEPIELWSRRLADARLEAAKAPEERVAILAGEVERLKKIAGDLRELAQTAQTIRVLADTMTFHQLDAESRLAREKDGR